MFSSCFHTSFKEKFTSLLDKSQLNQHEKDIIKARYVSIVCASETKSTLTNIQYYVLTNIVTVACILISSLVSLEKASIITHPTVIFWLIWSFSLIMLLANKWLYTFNIHKKYILNTTIMEKLYAEGWCFLAGVSRYSTEDKALRFNRFIVKVEKLKMKYVETISGLDGGEVGDGSLNTMRKSSSDVDVRDSKSVVIQIDNVDKPIVPTKQRKLFESDAIDAKSPRIVSKNIKIDKLPPK